MRSSPLLVPIRTGISCGTLLSTDRDHPDT